ncbi:MAG: gliding motility-associated C-terminal domain-containing protein [Bacteroidota bacterium]
MSNNVLTAAPTFSSIPSDVAHLYIEKNSNFVMDSILNDTIDFIIEVDSFITICANELPDYFSSNTTSTLCSGGTSGGDGTYGTYTVTETGCLNYTTNLIPGNGVDTICVIVEDDLGNMDTTVFIPSIICHTPPQIINVPCDTASTTGELCLPIPFDSISNYNIVLNGTPVQNGFVGCDQDSFIRYDYSLLFAQGNFGPYNLDVWMVDGQNLTVSFQTMQDLVDSMNVFDDANNWLLDATSFTILGGDAAKTYSDLIITHPVTNITGNFSPEKNYFSAGTAMTLPAGTHQIVYTRIGNNCPSDALQATVSCVPCISFLPTDTVQLTTINCLNPEEFCVEIPTSDIFDYNILVDGQTYGGAINACDFSGNDDGTTIELDLGLHEVIFTNISTACADTVLVEVSCPPCPDWLPDVLNIATTDCHLDVLVCTNIPSAFFSDYEVRDNGVLFSGATDNCDNGTDEAIALDTGFHQIIMTSFISGCSDTMLVNINCVPDTIVLDTVIQIMESDTFCLNELEVGSIANINITCGDTTSATVDYTFDTLSNCIIFTGIDLGFDTLCFEVLDSDGNQTDVLIDIIVSQVCTDEIIVETDFSLGLSDCDSTSTLCVDIPFSSITNFVITDNDLPYTDTIVGCDFDTILSYNYFTLPDQGTAGPYNVDAWTVNDSTFSGSFDSLSTLVDSMNIWDPMGNWILDTNMLLITGGDLGNAYGSITVTQVNTSALALLELNTNLIPTGSAITVSEGIHEFVFIDTTTFCLDTIQVAAVCLLPETVMDTVEVGLTETICIDTSELAGNVVSISNACPDQSGNFVSFTIDSNSYCVDYQGIAPGDEIACIIVCDDLGLCDTTTLMMHVPLDTTTTPLAFDDADTTLINESVVIDILENDSINGVFENITILLEPSNGNVTLNPDGTITYNGDFDYCNSTVPDTLIYELCNTVGCDTATVLIWVLCNNTGPLQFYNGFSPNGDNVNDVFYIQGLDDFPDNILCIFNRWGNRVYIQEGYNNTWDGTWEGIRLPEGTYFYVFDDGAGRQYSGYIQLTR